MTYDAWAAERLVADPDATLDPDLARADYLGWVSDRITRPEPRSRQRAAVKAAGATPKGRGQELRYLGVRLAGPPADSGYRVATRGTDEPTTDPTPALLALHAAGLVTDSRALDQAWLRLTGTPARHLCPYCGQITRHEAGHTPCRRKGHR